MIVGCILYSKVITILNQVKELLMKIEITLGSIGHYFEEQVHFNIPFQYIFLFLTYQRSNFGLLHDLLNPLITQHMGKNCIVNVKNCYGEL